MKTRIVTYDMPEEASHWDNDPDHSYEDWKYEVANEDTRIGYWEWVMHRKEQALWEKEDD